VYQARQYFREGKHYLGLLNSLHCRITGYLIYIHPGGTTMAAIKMIEETEATERVKKIYGDIKESLGIDFVPNMYRAMAHKPDFLAANWEKIKAVMQQEGKLDRLTKEIIAVAVSAVMGCEY
jgi:alkylhydroperoxidase/carboxymuconolactone decarboxylase family protein YurZ